MFIKEYENYKKEQAKALAKMRSAARVLHPFVVLALAAAFGLAVFSFVNTRGRTGVDHSKPLMKIKVFSVGYGYSALLRTPSGTAILIDAGPPVPKNAEQSSAFCLPVGADVWKSVIKKYLDEAGIKKLDALVITCPGKGFCGGAMEILKSGFPVGSYITSDIYFPGPRFMSFRNAKEKAKGMGIFKSVAAGDVFFKKDGVTIQALGPLIDYSGYNDFPKNGSLVLRVVFGNTALIYGSGAALASLNHIAAYKGLASDVLVTPDYCSADSFSISFMEAVDPEVCVVSVGRGNAGENPDSKVLAVFDAAHIKYFRTDFDGNLSVLSDGKKMEVKKGD